MVKITYKDWLYWPLTEEQYLKWQKPASILLRVKVLSITFFGTAIATYFYFDRPDLAFIAVSAGLGAVVGGISYCYYNALRSETTRRQK